MRKHVTILLIALCFTIAAVWAQYVLPPLQFIALSPDAIPTAQTWNTQITSLYTWANTNIAGTLNVLTNKGDMYWFNGVHLDVNSVGSDGTYLVTDSNSGEGLFPTWEALTIYDPATAGATKGSVITYDGAEILVIPPGADGTMLIANSHVPGGMSWIPQLQVAEEFPVGTIIPWSWSAGGDAIPAGFQVCDGSNMPNGSPTPNLIGMFVIGSKPAGNPATPNTAGFGYDSSDELAMGTATHVHGVAFSANNVNVDHSAVANTRRASDGVIVTGSGTGNDIGTYLLDAPFRPIEPIITWGSFRAEVPVFDAFQSFGIQYQGPHMQPIGAAYTHSTAFSNLTSGAHSCEPADYALVYIIKVIDDTP